MSPMLIPVTNFLSISEAVASPEARGFAVDSPAVSEHLGRIGRTFLAGYHATLETHGRGGPDALARRLDGFETGWRGFAFEGAGMALALLDYLTLPRAAGPCTRLRRFVEGPAWKHRYLLHVGAGWTLARVPRRLAPFLRRMEPRYRWLPVDGYGFHHGYFGWRRSVRRQRVPRRLRGYARRAFDQGLGRSLWFVFGASPERIGAALDAFPEARRRDLWSGVGLAATFAGGVAPEAFARLRGLAGPWVQDLAQGAAFAAEARLAADDPPPHLEAAARTLCGVGAATAAELTRRAGESAEDAPEDSGEPLYERWRRRTRELLLALQGAVA